MRKITICTFLLIFCQIVLAQFTNTGLPLGITTGTTISGQVFNSQGTVNNDGVLVMSGDVTASGYAGTGTIKLSGADQTMDLGTDTDISSLQIAGSGTKTINSIINVTSSLDFTGGKLLVPDSELKLGSGAVVSGAGPTNYIVGKLIRSGTGNLFYPIGDSADYTPVTLNGVTGTGPDISVRLFNADPAGQIGFGIVGLSQDRYWQIVQEGGTFDGASITLPAINESVIGNISEGVVAAASLTGDTYRGLGQASNTGDITSGSVTSQDTFGEGNVTIGKFFDEQLRVNDSTALLTIYNNTGGESWVLASGWNADDLDNWSGITTQDKRVSTVSLPSNNLTGAFPEISSGLENTTDIDVSFNELTDFGTLSSLTGLQNLNVSGNRLQFGPLETLVAGSWETIYDTQKVVLQRQRVLKQLGTSQVIDRTVSGTANTYNWFNKGAPITQSGPSFELTDLDFVDEGNFTARVTNTNVPGLTISTAEFILRVSSLKRDSASLKVIYDSMGGETWTRGSDWPALPALSWNGKGVTIANNRVTQINLGNNGLTGEVPEDIIDLENLTVIELQGNNIDALPDMTSLTNVTSLDVSNNTLDFGDLEPNVDVLTKYSPQAKIGETLKDSIDRGEDYTLFINVGGSENAYTWEKDTTRFTKSVFDPKTVASTAEYLITDIDIDNMGRHRLKVTNALLPDLTLVSVNQTIWAKGDIEFTPIYTNRLDNPAQLDEGEAYLFQVIPNKPFDSIDSPKPIDQNGILFENVVLGDFLIFVRTDTLLLRDVEGETDSIKLLPTYYTSTIDWAEADTLELRDFFADSLFMQQQPRPLTAADGDGFIGLLVESDLPEGEGEEEGRLEARRRVKKAGCSLSRRRTTGGGRPAQEEDVFDLIAYQETDDNGEVNFGFLPTGFYRLNIQYPGVPMDPNSFVEFEISEDEENDGYELGATVREDGITVEVIEELGFYRKYFKDLNVFPVPADRSVTITYKKLNNDGVKVKLVDLRGLTVLEQKLERGTYQQMQLDVSDVVGGVYLMYFYDEANEEKSIVYYKVIVRH